MGRSSNEFRIAINDTELLLKVDEELKLMFNGKPSDFKVEREKDKAVIKYEVETEKEHVKCIVDIEVKGMSIFNVYEGGYDEKNSETSFVVSTKRLKEIRA